MSVDLEAKRLLMSLSGVFNTMTTVRSPGPDYTKAQQLLEHLRERPQGERDGKANLLYKKLRECFRDEFRLELSRSRFDWTNKVRSLLGDDDSFFDHPDYFSIGRRPERVEVIIVQPYGWYLPEDVRQIAINLATVHGELVDLNEWAYYYPGKSHASCWGLVLNKASEVLLERDFCYRAKFIFT